MRRIHLVLLALTAAALPLSARASQVDVLPVAVEHGPRTDRRVALTFDACTTRDPSPYDPRVTAVLERMHVPATLFVGGGWAEEEAAQLAELARDPLFEIGNHTFTHPHLTRISDVQIRNELLRTQAAIASRTGHVPTLFRPSYGEYDGRVLRIASAAGLTTIEYDLPSGDPDAHVTRQALVDWVLREARPGSIIVMHVNHRRFHTWEALPQIVDGLRARGFELVKVSELLRLPQASAPIASAVAPSLVRAPVQTRAHKPARAEKPISGV